VIGSEERARLSRNQVIAIWKRAETDDEYCVVIAQPSEELLANLERGQAIRPSLDDPWQFEGDPSSGIAFDSNRFGASRSL
jgi:hypothetical protein